MSRAGAAAASLTLLVCMPAAPPLHAAGPTSAVPAIAGTPDPWVHGADATFGPWRAPAAPWPPSLWACERCDGGPTLDIDTRTGGAAVFGDAFRFGNVTGIDGNGGMLFGDLLLRYADDSLNRAFVEGYVRGDDAYGVFASGGRQGSYEVSAVIQSVPWRDFDTGLTPFLGSGGNDLTLRNDWVRGPGTGDFARLPVLSAPVDIRGEWTRQGLGLMLRPGGDWRLDVDYQRRERKGVVRGAGSFLFTALEFASPVDYRTDDVEVTLQRTAQRWSLSVGYFASTFRNDYEALAWDNPYATINGNERGQQALAPDNDAHRLTMAGSARLPVDTTVSGHLSVGRLQQDTRLLPFTVNPGLPAGELPGGTSAGAEVETVDADLRVVSSPLPRLTLEGELRYRNFDNRTPILSYDYIITDTLPAGRPATSTAFDYRRREVSFEAAYRLRPRTRIAASYDYERFDRNRQARDRTETDRVGLSLRSRVGYMWEFTGEGFVEDRDGSTYEEFLGNATPQNPLLRKYNLADRDRRGAQLRAGLLGVPRSDFGFEVQTSEDRYGDTVIGLTQSDYLRFGADASLMLSPQASAYLSVHREHYSSRQANSQSFAEPDWTATTEDTFTTAILGASHADLFGRLQVSGELIYGHSVGEIRTDTSGLTSTFPDLSSIRHAANLTVDYPINDRVELGLSYFYERLRTDDWSLDGVEQATVPSLLALGVDAWNYEVHVVYLNITVHGAGPRSGRRNR